MEKHFNCIFKCNNPDCGCVYAPGVFEGPLDQALPCPKEGCGGMLVYKGVKR